jgi:hypothetical protein
MNMEAWWGSLGTALQIFYAIAVATSALLTIQLVLIVLGIDGEADIDDVDAGGGVLSVRTVTAFFTGFGWTGVVALESGLTLPLTLLAATAVGGVFLLGVLMLMRALSGLRYSGTLDYHNAVGSIGSVYLRVPPGMSGPGQVEVIVQGRLRVVQAFTRSERELPNRSRVKVVDVMDQTTLIVEPLESSPTQPKQEG